MNWPDEPVEDRARDVIAMTALNHLPEEVGVLLSVGTVRRLITDPPETVPTGVLIVYVVLVTNLQCATHHPELVGYRRAGKLLKWASDSTIKRAWWKYSPVGSLWLAKSFSKSITPSLETFQEYLAYAEALRRWGEQIYAHGQRKHGKPLLDPDKTWKCPQDLQLPQVEVDLPPLKPSELRDLRRAYQGVQRS